MKLSLHPKKRKAFEIKAPAAYVEVWQGGGSTRECRPQACASPRGADGEPAAEGGGAVGHAFQTCATGRHRRVRGLFAFFQLERGNGEILV
jgi:hypothetical protein